MSAIGIAGEDMTDCETIAVIVRRLVPRTVKINKRAPHRGGCATLRRKAASYFREFRDGGCDAAVLVHDLDRDPRNGQLNEESILRDRLEGLVVPGGLRRLVCIPVEEVEAWFWSDQRLIEKIGKGHGRASPSPPPHLIAKPKEKLRALSALAHRKPVYSTNQNEALAAELDLAVCAERCLSFRALRDFVTDIFG